MSVVGLYRYCFYEPILNFATERRIAIYPRLIGSIFLSMLTLFFVFNRPLMALLGKMSGADFIAFYTAARFFITGMTDKLYNFAAQATFQQQLIEQSGFATEQIGHSFTAYLNPPFAAILYLPFGLEKYLVGYSPWIVINVVCFIFALYLIKSHWLVHTRLSLSVLILSSFSFFPTIVWITYAQATGILYLLLTLALVTIPKGREFLGGFILGLCAFKPQVALCIAVSLILKFRWRALLGGVVSVSLWILLGLAFFSIQMQEYWEMRSNLISILIAPGFKTCGIHSFYGFSHLLLGSFSTEVADCLWIALSIGALTLLARYWWKITWQRNARQRDRGIAGAFAISLLLSVQLYSYDFTLLLIPFLLIVASLPEESEARKLDNSNILLWTIVVDLLCMVGPYLTSLQLFLTSTESFGGLTIQLSTISISVWGGLVLKSASVENTISVKNI